ncbi:copper amine oxidase N-terminal domain-containing protein [Anaerotignum sp.]|uniref:copper amine oxidase N-terminal domain-containing protein n=1 Tax=Anaerotignum sp. TaxID=2039241 RepID=UPI002714DE37|nr:copper amine oxidase N-terminal domain-containing protein [Anaerotignum sp.]
MILKKTAIIVCVSAAMICGAIALSMRLTEAKELEMEVSNPKEEITEEEQTKVYSEGENIPLYYDEEDMLLLPVRNVAQGLGGTVTWDRESRSTIISYKGKKLILSTGSTKAQMHGYNITLPTDPEMINGCLYAEASVLSDFFSIEVHWNSEKKQISLKTKDGSTPIVANDILLGKNEEKEYSLEIPVIMGLNDVRYEKGLNKEIRQAIQSLADEFMVEEGQSVFHLQIEKGFVNGDFLSLCWKGSKGERPFYKTINIDFRQQKEVNLSDILTENAVQELKKSGDLIDSSIFYISQQKELVILDSTKAELLPILLPANGDLLEGQWNTKYQSLFCGDI